MPIPASKIPSVVAMSNANIRAKRDLRRVIRDCIPALTTALDTMGDDPIVCHENRDLEGRLQHVDLAVYYPQVAEINALLNQAYGLMADMHNEQTAHGQEIGIVMDAPNGGGGGR